MWTNIFWQKRRLRGEKRGCLQKGAEGMVPLMTFSEAKWSPHFCPYEHGSDFQVAQGMGEIYRVLRKR